MKTGLRCGRRVFIKTVFIIIFVFFTAAPVLYLLVKGLTAYIGGKAGPIPGFSTTLFAQTVLLDMAAAGGACALGFITAIGIWVGFPRKASAASAAVLLLFLVPAFIHIQSWVFFADRMSAALNPIFNISLNFTGRFAVVLTASFSYLPISCGLFLAALASVPNELRDQCLLEADLKTAFQKVYLPFLATPLYLGMTLIFLLCVSDYSLPSAFGVNVFSLELFARFSAGAEHYEILFLSAPFLFLCAAAMILIGRLLYRSPFIQSPQGGIHPFVGERFLRAPACLGMTVGFLFLAVPFLNLWYEAFRCGSAAEILSGSMDELLYSLGIGALSSILCLVLSIPFAILFRTSKYRLAFLAAAAIPFLIPSPVAGLAMIELWNTPPLSSVYQSPLMPAVAMVSKYTFIGTFILSAGFSRIDRELFDSLRIYAPGLLSTGKCVYFLIRKECAAVMLIIFALSMGEFGMTLLVTPPGYQTLTIKIYNYLHYGASDTIAVLCLFTMAIVTLSAWIVYTFLSAGGNGGEHDQTR